MSKLSQEERDKLPAEHFAVPGKRALPMHDATHVRLAWDMVDRTEGLSEGERAEARRRIIHRAHELGVDTSGWSKGVHGGALDLRAMALNVPDTPEHPNKHPFRGVLTRLDEPSDEAPGGTGGRLAVLTRAAAEAALPTLLGMAIDFAPDLGGHDVARKIGIITAADIVGNAIEIAGYFYAQDFPDEMRRIRAEKMRLGFSFELTPTAHTITAENFYRVDSCVFTGAALLYRDKAAYRSTSLAAAKTEGTDMDLKALETQVGTLAAGLDTLTRLVQSQLAAGGANLAAANECMAAVEPHAARLEDAAERMRAAGIGLHPTDGHVVHLKRMAGRMRAAAALGQMPHIYRDHDYPMEAQKAAVVPAEITALTASVAEVKTALAELKAAQRATSQEPGRKTMPATVTALLRRHGINAMGEDGRPVTSDVVAGVLRQAGVAPDKRIEIIRAVERAELGLDA